jgi:hypothetical protein
MWQECKSPRQEDLEQDSAQGATIGERWAHLDWCAMLQLQAHEHFVQHGLAAIANLCNAGSGMQREQWCKQRSGPAVAEALILRDAEVRFQGHVEEGEVLELAGSREAYERGCGG